MAREEPGKSHCGRDVLKALPTAAALAERAEKKWFVVLTYLFFTLFPVAVVLSRSFVHLVLAVAGAAAIGGALWTVRPALTFAVAAGLGALGTLFAAVFLPSSSPAGRESTEPVVRTLLATIRKEDP